MAEDVKQDIILEGSLPPDMTIIKEETSLTENDNPRHSNSKLHFGNPASKKEGITENNTSTSWDSSTVQFPKPIVVPKIEISISTNSKPKIIDMLDLETENESEDSTNEESDSSIDKSIETPTGSINRGDKNRKEFPKPIVVPKIEISISTNSKPKIIDMLDLETENESEDSTNEESDSSIDKSIETQTGSINRGDKNRKELSNLVSEEIDLGTNVVTKDGEVKIYGLAENLGLHLPKTELDLNKNFDVLTDSKASTVNVKVKNVARKKTTTVTVVSKEIDKTMYSGIKTNAKTNSSKAISKIVFESKSASENDNSEIKTEENAFFCNKIILGNRSKLQISKFAKREPKIVAKDCYSEYINSPNYCIDCNILFTTYKSFDIHYILKHLNNNEGDKTKDTDLGDKESLGDSNNKPFDSRPTKVTKDAKADSKSTKNNLIKYKCEICSTLTCNKANMKRHINSIHNAQINENLFQKIVVPNDNKNSNNETASSAPKGKISKKTNSDMTKNDFKVLKSSVGRRNETTYENNLDVASLVIDKPSKAVINTTEKRDSKQKPVSNNITDLISKIKNNHCVHCDKTFTNKEEIISHLYDLLLPKIYTCNICNLEFVSEDALKEHFKSHNEGVKVKIVKLGKTELNKYTTKKINTGLSKRSAKSNPNRKKQVVDDDSDTSSGPDSSENVVVSSYNVKNTSYESNKGVNTKVVKFKCNLCFALISNTANVRRHIKNVHGKTPKKHMFKKVIVSKNYPIYKVDLQKRSVVKDNYDYSSDSVELDEFENNYESNDSLDDEQSKMKETRDTTKNKIFGSKSHADKHKKILRKTKKNNDKAEINSHSPINTVSNPPVPKAVLFKCDSCGIHFISCLLAVAHVNSCPGPTLSWECPECFKKIKLSDKAMHKKQHQYLRDEDFVVHTIIEENSTAILAKVMHCCPKCGVHYSEKSFTKHYEICDQEVPNSYFCLKCDMLIDESHKQQHLILHSVNEYSAEDFIIIEYELSDLDHDDIIRINKDDTESHDNSIHTDNENEVMSEDYQSDVVGKSIAVFDDIEPNDVEVKTDCRVVRLIYCETCKTYISPFRPNNLAHFYGYCSSLLTTTCTVCGLAFTCRSIYSHRNLHKRIQNFSILNFVFYNMQFEQIDPVIPDLPKCSHCLLTFDCADAKVNHECGEPKYKSCYYCGDDFNELAYKTHILFHEYVNKKTILPMSSYDINKLSSIIQKKAVGSTYNFTFYQCEECEVVLDEINRDIHKKAKGDCLDLSHTYKKCFKCHLTILAKEFAHHSARHDRNSTFKLENFNIIPFKRTEVNVARNFKKISTKPIVKRKRKIVDNEVNVKAKNKKTDVDRQTNSDDSNFELIDAEETPVMEITEDEVEKSDAVPQMIPCGIGSLFKCRSCLIVLLKQPSTHKCEDKEEEQTCDKCNLRFYKKDYDAHKIFHQDSQFEIEKAISYFGSESNTITGKDNEVIIEKIYRCLCGLHFLTKPGIFEHYSQCNITTRIVKQNCTKCNLLFSPAVLFNHLVTHHSKNKEFKYDIVDLTEYTSENRDEIYQCEICTSHFVVRELCEVHTASCKGEDKRLTKKCPHCGLNVNVDAFPIHRRKHHVAKKMRTEDFDTIVINPKEIQGTEDIINENDAKQLKSNKNSDVTAFHLNVIDNLNIDSEIVTIEPYCKRGADKIFQNLALENYSNVLYKCAECDLHFNGRRSFQAHSAKKCHAQNILVVACSVCSLKFSSENCMRHEYIHHNKLKLKLEDFEIKTHYEKPKKEKERIKRTSTTHTLTEKAKAKILKNKKMISNIIYKCSVCDVYFVTPNTAFVHARKFKHIFKWKLHKCQVCDISMSANSLERHKYIHHELNDYKFEDLKVEVDVTYSYTKSKKRFNKSLVDVNRYTNKIYKCIQCDLSHLTFGALRLHIIDNNHNIKTRKIKCKICNEKFTPLGLAKHKYVHHKTFKLGINEFEIVDNISLKDLLEKRRQETMASEWQVRGSKQTIIYRCKECNICLLTRKTWRSHNFVHIRVLERQKRKCDECGLNFTNRALNWHKNVHHKEKGYTLDDFWIEESIVIPKNPISV